MRPSLLLLALPLSLACAQVPAAPEAPRPSAVKEISPGLFQIGQARLEQSTRTIKFPAAINMTDGLLEYLLVSRDGPTHESLLVSDLEPNDLHLAMLLLGAKGSPAAKGAQPAPGQITEEYLKRAPALTGESVSLTVTWKGEGAAEKSGPVEDWLLYGDTNKPPARGPWLYTGSVFGSDGQFIAQQQGVFAALVTNPAALINNPRKGHDSDKVWSVNTKAVPPAETPLTVELKLLGQDAGKKK